jgi:hypothetical protein
VIASARLAMAMGAALLASVGCEEAVPGTVDPGPAYSVPLVQFNANYFYCVVEPQVIMGGLTGTACGNNGSGGCHYSDKVPAMVLEALPTPVTCSGSGVAAVPTNQNQVVSGTAASNNLTAVSQQMSTSYMDAPIYTWPSGTSPGHPVIVFSPTDQSVINILQTWAMQ